MISTTNKSTEVRVKAWIYLVALAAAASFAVLPSTASAGTTVNAPASPSFNFQGWVNAALTPTPNTPVNVIWDHCPAVKAAAGCANYDVAQKAGTIWIDPAYRNSAEYAIKGIFFHELGHIFDALQFNDTDRKMISGILGFPIGSEWLDPANGQEAFSASPGEWFAETARLCFAGDTESTPSYGYPYKAAQIQPICSLMKVAALRKPPPELVGTTFTQTVPAGKKFESSTRFVSGSIRMTATVDGKTFTWGNVCTRSVLRNGVALYANSCNTNVVLWSKGTRPVTVTFSGMPQSTPSKVAGTITKIAARKKNTRTR